SLALFTDRPLDVHEVARRLIMQLDEEYDRLSRGDLGSIESRWKWHAGLLGKAVTVECHDAEHEGRLMDMRFDAVILEQGGDTRTTRPESVRHLREMR